jgi:hypothetical protein
MARDKFHQDVRLALETDGWTITSDPLTFKVGRVQIQIDLGAERVIAAERGMEKIAIEVKTFSNLSFITALYEAVGKYVIYRNILRLSEPDRMLFLAIPDSVFNRFFDEPVLEDTLRHEDFKMIVYDQTSQLITKWIK